MRHLALISLVLAAGCGAPKKAVVDTGARAAALAFCEAIIRSDWEAVRDLADPKTAPEAGQLARLASQYRKSLGMEPEVARIRSCEEQEGRAIAHFTFTGGRKQYRGGWELRLHEGKWVIVLPASFGR